jgi:hypothetical protein
MAAGAHASRSDTLPAFCQIPSPDRLADVGERAAMRCFIVPSPHETKRMRADPSIDPNAELRSFEPLRVVLALGSLLLALLMSLP